jgi:hypothetical protein
MATKLLERRNLEDQKKEGTRILKNFLQKYILLLELEFNGQYYVSGVESSCKLN